MVAQAALIAAGINFASGFLKGKQEEYEAKVQAKLALNNAAIYRKNASTVRLNGSLNEDMMRSQKRAAVASAAAAAGEAGMGESPTTTTALATTSAALEQNILNERYRVESEAENYLYQARLAEEQARQHKKAGKNKFMNSMLGGLTSSLGGLFE